MQQVTTPPPTTLIVLVASIVIDKLLTPIWKQMDILGNKLSLKLGY